MAPLRMQRQYSPFSLALHAFFSILVQDGSVPAAPSEMAVTPVVVPEPVKIEVKEVPAPVKQEMKEIEKPKAVVVEEEQDDDDFVVVDNEEEEM